MKRVALIAVVIALASAGSALAAFTKADGRATAAAKLSQFDRNHGWVKSRELRNCSKGRAAVRCLGVVQGVQKSCRLRIVILASAPKKARIKRIACSTGPAGAERIRLRAHLSSAPKRDLQNPFKVTYDYSASATKQLAAAALEEPTQPPAGVLALYSDGILECATNVGGGFASGECPVTYKALGEHRVTSIYTSGDESATVTEVQTINPIPTSTSIDVVYTPFPEASYLASGCEAEVCELEEGFFGNADVEIGTLTVTVKKVTPWDTFPLTKCPPESGAPAGCVGLTLTPDGIQTFPVVVLTDLLVEEDQVLVEGEPIAAEMLAPHTVFLPGGGQVASAVIEAGSRVFWARSGERSGYVSSEDVGPIQFTPKATPTIRFR